jgi:RIO-like serine/threonine protein kinase
MTAVSPDGTVTQYRAIVTSDGEVTILDWPQ